MNFKTFLNESKLPIDSIIYLKPEYYSDPAMDSSGQKYFDYLKSIKGKGKIISYGTSGEYYQVDFGGELVRF